MSTNSTPHDVWSENGQVHLANCDDPYYLQTFENRQELDKFLTKLHIAAARAWPEIANPENTITFNLRDSEVIRLDFEGFHYRGQFISDAGEARRLMVEFLMQQVTSNYD